MNTVYFTLIFYVKFVSIHIFTESDEVLVIEEINPKELYGSKVDEIELLENNLQSVFESFCVVKKPILWPGLALNLSITGTFFIFYYFYY